MFWNRDNGVRHRPTDSDVRCVLLLSAVRAFSEAQDAANQAAREHALLAEYAELVVWPPVPEAGTF